MQRSFSGTRLPGHYRNKSTVIRTKRDSPLGHFGENHVFVFRDGVSYTIQIQFDAHAILFVLICNLVAITSCGVGAEAVGGLEKQRIQRSKAVRLDEIHKLGDVSDFHIYPSSRSMIANTIKPPTM
jgi:hypothetical protein